MKPWIALRGEVLVQRLATRACHLARNPFPDPHPLDRSSSAATYDGMRDLTPWRFKCSETVVRWISNSSESSSMVAPSRYLSTSFATCSSDSCRTIPRLTGALRRPDRRDCRSRSRMSVQFAQLE